MKESIKEICRRFRKNQTKAESNFWNTVRNRQLEGYKIQRQYPINFEWNNKNKFFIADFYCHEAKLIIEIDGGIHETQKNYDKNRDKIIKLLGYNIIRFQNEEIMKHLDNVIKKLKKEISLGINSSCCPSLPLKLEEKEYKQK
jgi:very-short-patch-repair endonuclease